MAIPALIPIAQIVYRGMRNPSWSRRGVVSYLAFMLRPATANFPIEDSLSLGLTVQSAVDELDEHFGVAGLAVGRIHGLGYEFEIRPDPDNDSKAYLFGLPLHSTEPEQISLAIAIATDLASIAYLVPVNPLPN
jgi:hypothetical protein